MSEIEYVIVSNKTILVAVGKLLQDLTSNKAGTYGVTEKDRRELTMLVEKMRNKAFDKVPELQ